MNLFFNVNNENKGKRLDIFLAKISGFSRSKIQKLIKNGNVLLDGVPISNKSYKVNIGDSFKVCNKPENIQLIPYNEIKIKLIYEDEDIIVVHKPYGLLTHPTNYEQKKTLVNAVLSFCKLPESDNYHRPGIVHRLDKYTEGIMIIAKSEKALIKLQKSFMNREIKKEYIAIVHNKPPNYEGEINLFIKRANSQKGRYKTSNIQGKPAYPNYKLIDIKNTKIGTFSKLLLFPKTGRTHQIRVHLVSLNTPIVGDPLYSRKHNKFPRMFLLAKSIVFNHPKNNKLMNFSIEEPYEFHKFWNSL